MGLYRVFSELLLKVTGHDKVHNLMMQFYRDIGGEKFTLPTSHGSVIQGIFFDVQKYGENKASAYAKWIKVFSHPVHKQEKDFLTINSNGTDLSSMFNLPPLEQTAGKIKGMVWCIGAGNLVTMDPQGFMMYLERGISAAVFHYGGVLDSQGEPNCLTTSLDALAVTRYVQGRLKCSNSELAIHGKSLGTGPSLYTGTQLRGIKVIADRGFSRLTDVINTFVPPFLGHLLSGPINKFYPYPNLDMIPKVEGPILVIAAKNDEMMVPEHGKKLASAVKKAQGPKAFRLVVGPGMHSGDVWYKDPATQSKLTKFLNK